ncbi:RNA-directed DNA polymerase from mobile element jockey [Trichonephila clavipes]|nr:RNA-directed DNA polymerase from mobile element jockey [Trichonephila clavipes]
MGLRTVLQSGCPKDNAYSKNLEVSRALEIFAVSAEPGFRQMTGTLLSLLDSLVDGGTPERSCVRDLMDPMLLCPGKGLVLPNHKIDKIATNTRFLLISLNNNEMSTKPHFEIHKALMGIGGEPKSVKKLRSGDLLIETSSAVQTKSFLLAKSFLNSPVNITSHKSLNSSCGRGSRVV